MSDNSYSIDNILSYNNVIHDMLNTIADNSDNINTNDSINNDISNNNYDDKNNIISSFYNSNNIKTICPYCNVTFENQITLNLHTNRCVKINIDKFNKMSTSITFSGVIDPSYRIVSPPSLYNNY